MRFVATGSGRCGTKYLSLLLTAAGVPCGHEKIFNAAGRRTWPQHLQADSSWMAVPRLPAGLPVVLLVRHPLPVVASWVEIGFFTHDLANPTHRPLRSFASEVYQHTSAPDRALAMWTRLNSAALRHAEALLRLEQLDVQALRRLLRWAGADPATAADAFGQVAPTNRHERMRRRTGIIHERSWEGHDPALARRARQLARLLGYDPDEVPGG